MFNYSKFHIFDKKGNELPLSYDSNIKIVINNKYDDNAIFFGVTDVSTNLNEYYKLSSGGRFTKDDFKHIPGVGPFVASATIYSNTGEHHNNVPISYKNYLTSEHNECCISELMYIGVRWSEDPSVWKPSIEDLTFPSLTFSTKISFDKVSTELVETQELYFLIEYTDSTGKTYFIKPNDYINLVDLNQQGQSYRPAVSDGFVEWANRYRLLTFIDCRNQNDFRLFNVNLGESEDVTWSDRNFMDFNSTGESGYKVNVGFSGENEGVYRQSLYICLIDTYQKEYENDPGQVYPIGEIVMNAETEGEDERYRTLFTNFGIPDPKTYNDIFKGSDSTDEKNDYISINEHSKQMFLSYSEIFPYVGTYKALINAVNALGYDDIFFKEWYKHVGTSISDANKYIAYDITYDTDISKKIINTIPLEEKLKLKKLNWISMMYNLNKELYDVPEDKYGFPSVELTYNYYNTNNIVKLLSLRKWLEKYIIGLNCRIIDVGGEGIYFERYKVGTYGAYQQLLEFNADTQLEPVVINEDNVLKNSSANIVVQVDKLNNAKTFESYENIKFEDLCSGFLDSSDNYRIKTTEIYDASISQTSDGTYDTDKMFIGESFEDEHLNDSFVVRASSSVDSFMFGTTYVDENSPKVIIRDGVVSFDPEDLIKKQKNSAFKTLPIIQLERATLKIGDNEWERSVTHKIYPDTDNGTWTSYIIEDVNTSEKCETQDYPMFVPPAYEDSSTTVTIKPINGESFTIDKWKYLIGTFDFSSDGRYQTKCKENNTTYGLRFSKTNAYNIPVFSMLGYTLNNQTTNIIKSNVEYYLDILDGKIMFDDVENNRRIYINFTYYPETKTKDIKVNIVYQSDEFNDCVYLPGTSDQFSRFFNGNNYTRFKNTYKTSINDAIKNNIDDHNRYVKKIKVNNSGEFAVDLLSYKDNITYGVRSNKNAYIRTMDPQLLTYTNEMSSNNEFDIDGSPLTYSEKNNLVDNFSENCIYEYKEPIRNIEFDSSTMEVTYPSYVYNTDKPIVGESAHFINNMDKFKLAAIDKVNITGNLVEFFLILNRWDNKEYSHVHSVNDTNALMNTVDNQLSSSASASDVLQIAENSSSKEALDVNVVLYDELSNCVLVQMPGKMVNGGCVSKYSNRTYSDDEYHLYISDDLNTGAFERYRYIYHDPETPEKKFKVKDGYLYQLIDGEWVGKFVYRDASVYMIEAETYEDTYGNECIKYKLPFFDDMEWDSSAGVYKIINRVVTRVDESYIMKYIQDTHIGIYVEPTWKEKVTIVSVDDEKNLIVLDFPYKLYNRVFKKGDIVKIVYESGSNSDYIGQSSYEVYGYDVLNNYLLLNGRINSAYLSKTNISLAYGRMVSDLIPGSTTMYQYTVTDNGLLAKWNGTKYDTEFSYTDPSTATTQKFTLKAKSGGYEDDKYVILYQIARWDKSAQRMDLNIHTEEIKSNLANAYISYAHNACVDYTMKISELNEFNAEYGKITIEDTYQNKFVSKYVDQTFGMVYRDFDINEGTRGWMGSGLTIDLKAIPNIADNPIYKYECPVSVHSQSPCIAFEIDFTKLDVERDDISVCWEIFKRENEYGEQKKLFETYTKSLFLDYTNPGIYDLKVSLYDKYGNPHIKEIMGAYRVI